MMFVRVSFAVLCIIRFTEALRCLSCDNVLSARDCVNIIECGPHQECYAAQAISEGGHIYRQLGCKDTRKCVPAPGKRSISDVIRAIPDSDVTVCDECCNTEFCQAGLCHDRDYEADRGPICYNCDQQSSAIECDEIVECGRDEGCMESLGYSPTGIHVIQTGCMSKSVCDGLLKDGNVTAGAENTKPGQHCFTCCNSDLCNTSCHPPAGSQGNCTDSTDEYTCKLASPIVCGDLKLATNAGCPHYCGFC